MPLSRLVSSVLAARSSPADVLAFKAAIDELSRLSCARTQDEALLRELKTQLLDLEPAVAARLLTECRFRDEWREEKCSKALSTLPSSEADPVVVERMREYVALLAPPEEETNYDGGDQGWQGELLRQQRTLASLLTLCAGGSSDRVLTVLTDFMEHSRTRLHEQLACVHEHLLNVAAHGSGGGRARRSPDGGLPARSPNGKATSSPRQAWVSEDAASNQRPPPPPPPPPPEGFLGLSADAFVEQLRGQHRAVCGMQAVARGRRQRQVFQRLVHERLGAAVRLQCAMRQGAARWEIAAQRHRCWVDACNALTQHYNARRAQRAWRWVRRKRGWASVWRAREAEAARKDDTAWRRVVCAALGPREVEQHGFSEFSIYTEAKSLAVKREAEESGARRVQAAGRAALVRAARRRLVRAACVLQAHARRRHAVGYDCPWRKGLLNLHARRRARLHWRTSRATALALQPLQTRAVLVQLHVSKELEHLRSEATREKAEFEEAFRKWQAKMERLTLAKKLHADWIPQMNVERGESYYFNVRTGESSEEHPNMKIVRSTEKKQRQLAEEQMGERLSRLQQYEEQLNDGQSAQLESYSQAAARVLADSAALSLPWANVRWVKC